MNIFDEFFKKREKKGVAGRRISPVF